MDAPGFYPNAGFEIRPATAADDFAVGELLVAAFLEAYARKMPEVVLTEERFAELRNTADKRARGTVLVAASGAEILGTVMVLRPGGAGSEAWLADGADLRQLGVARAGQGRGISAALMDAAERVARDLGARAICLHVRRGALGVARFYLQRGYARAPEGDFEGHHVTLDGYLKLL